MSALGQKRTLAARLLAASLLFVSESSTPCGKPERIFSRCQPAIADDIFGIERWCLTASLRGAASRGHQRRADPRINVAVSEGLLQRGERRLASTMTRRDVLDFESILEGCHDFRNGVIRRDNQMEAAGDQ